MARGRCGTAAPNLQPFESYAERGAAIVRDNEDMGGARTARIFWPDICRERDSTQMEVHPRHVAAVPQYPSTDHLFRESHCEERYCVTTSVKAGQRDSWQAGDLGSGESPNVGWGPVKKRADTPQLKYRANTE
jgi:hypothetical protein